MNSSKKTLKNSTLILFDIGNTAVTCGVYQGGRLLESKSLLFNDIPKFIKICNKSGVNNDYNIVISSVVPKYTQKLKRMLSSKYRVWVVGENLPVPIKHRYKAVKQLGQDRIVNIYGALRIYKAPLLIIDYGTAITFDYVSKSGVFEGGMILPGPEIAFQTLISRAARLPKKARLPHETASFLGRTTYDCMRSGILEGYGAMTDGLIERFKARYGKNLKVLATGGFARHLKPYAHLFDILDNQHSIKSLILLFKESRKR